MKHLYLIAILAFTGCSNLHWTGAPPEYLWAVPGYANFHRSAPKELKAKAPVPPFDPAILRPGDILLYAPSDLIGDIIAVKTGRLKSHTEGYLGNGKVIAARLQGVNIYPLRIDECLACVRRSPNCENFDTNAAMVAISPYIGKPYDVCGLFSFFNPWSVRKQMVLVCSPVVTLWSRAGGCEPFNPDLVSSGVTPGALFETGGLFTIWRNPVIDRAFP